MNNPAPSALPLATEAIEARMRTAISAAGAGASVAMSHLLLAPHGRLEPEIKADGTPVTPGDREAELAIRARINADFPDDGVLGEEYGEEPGSTGVRWIIDPIDGTKSYLRGVPLFGTLVAAEFTGAGGAPRIIAGAIDMPGLHENLHAGLGLGAWWSRGADKPTRAQVSTRTDPTQSCVCVTEIGQWTTPTLAPKLASLAQAFGAIRGWSDCYAHLLLATGRIEAVVEPSVATWDVAAASIIISEAGGSSGDWHGEGDHRSSRWLACSPALRKPLLDALADNTTKEEVRTR